MADDPFEEAFGPATNVARPESLTSAFPKGLLKTLQNLKLPYQAGGPINSKLGNKLLEQVLPTQNKRAEQILERTGKVLPYAVTGGESGLMSALRLLLGTTGGQAAKELGFGETGQDIGEIAAMSGPELLQAGKSLLQRGVKLTLPSGLTQPRAVGSKLTKMGSITPSRQEKSINKLNEEASALAKKSVEKHVPISKQIEEGVDFERRFEEGFGDIRKAAEKNNPEIDISPIGKLMSEVRSKFRGIPVLHGDAKKIMKELKGFANRLPTEMKNLLKIYRSNNQKVKHIFETSHLSGKQKEYVDFLGEYNKAIASSFRNTLPANSPWMKRFEALNKEFRDFQNANKVLNALKPILGENPKLGTLAKIGSDPKAEKKLSLAMGKEGAKEIAQLSRDLKQAITSVKKIPVREFKAWNFAAPLGYFIPFIGQLAGPALSVHKGVQFGRNILGRLLTTPKRRKIYSDILKSVKNKDLPAYRKAVTLFKNDLGVQEKDEFEKVGFK